MASVFGVKHDGSEPSQSAHARADAFIGVGSAEKNTQVPPTGDGVAPAGEGEGVVQFAWLLDQSL